jgi:CRP-like cAMP-binding protein
VIGETAFFSTAGRRTASVRAASDGRVVVLRRGDVDRMRQTDPACAAELLFELARVQADRTGTLVVSSGRTRRVCTSPSTTATEATKKPHWLLANSVRVLGER